MIIYPSQTIIRDTARSFEIDDNDPGFIRAPTGLFALYIGYEPALLLISTETEGHWDVVIEIQSIHLEKLRWLSDQAIQLSHKEAIITTQTHKEY